MDKKDVDLTDVGIIGLAIVWAGRVLQTWLRRRKEPEQHKPKGNAAEIPPNGGAAALDAFKTIGGQQAALVASYKEAAERAESRADRLEQEKEAMADELMKQATEIAELRADITIVRAENSQLRTAVGVLESQVAALLKQVEKLERKS